MSKAEALRDLVESSVSRREFARRAIAGGLMAGGAALVTPAVVDTLAQGLTDVDILNFALNLEYLEAEFYTVALTGQRINEIGIGITGTGRAGTTTGGGKVAMGDFTRIQAEHIARDEQQHVVFLRTALGSAAVAKPAINLEALTIGFRSENEFITLARAFEDLGMSAYAGAAPLIRSAAILEEAARIGLTEAQHVGAVRTLIAQMNLTQPQVDDKDVPPLGSPNGRYFQVDDFGRSTIRTASQVLAVAYGNSAGGTRAGGFYPEGVNGNITRV